MMDPVIELLPTRTFLFSASRLLPPPPPPPLPANTMLSESALPSSTPLWIHMSENLKSCLTAAGPEMATERALGGGHACSLSSWSSSKHVHQHLPSFLMPKCFFRAQVWLQIRSPAEWKGAKMRHLTAGQIWGQMWDPQLLITLPRLQLPLAGIYTCAQLCVRSA